MICTEYDNFVRDFTKTIWIVTLNDETKVYQDDGRPGVEIYSAWVRLKNFLLENRDKFIVEIMLKFRSHDEYVCNKHPLYFFSKKLIASPSGYREDNYLIGVQSPDNPDELIIQEWCTPALLFYGVEHRKIQGINDKCLIKNNI